MPFPSGPPGGSAWAPGARSDAVSARRWGWAGQAACTPSHRADLHAGGSATPCHARGANRLIEVFGGVGHADQRAHRSTHPTGRTKTAVDARSAPYLPLNPAAVWRRAVLCSGTSLYWKACSTCGAERTCDACVATRDCTECTRTARCGACRSIIFQARRQSPSTFSSQPINQGKRPRRQELDEPPSGELDRLDLPRDKSGLDVYYSKVSEMTSGVRKGGARWFVDAPQQVEESGPPARSSPLLLLRRQHHRQHRPTLRCAMRTFRRAGLFGRAVARAGRRQGQLRDARLHLAVLRFARGAVGRRERLGLQHGGAIVHLRGRPDGRTGGVRAATCLCNSPAPSSPSHRCLPACGAGYVASGCGSPQPMAQSAQPSSRASLAACGQCVSAAAGSSRCCRSTPSRLGARSATRREQRRAATTRASQWPPCPSNTRASQWPPCPPNTRAHRSARWPLCFAQVPRARAVRQRGALPQGEGLLPQSLHGRAGRVSDPADHRHLATRRSPIGAAAMGG